MGVFGAAAEDDQVIAGVAGVITRAVDGSKNPRSTATIVKGTEHGLPMFDKNPDLEPQLVSLAQDPAALQVKHPAQSLGMLY